MSLKSLAGSAVLALVGLSFLLSPSTSQGAIKDFRIYQQYQSVRAMGMGNAFTAVSDDYACLFYNPAGLARIEEGQLNLSIGASIDTKFPGFYSDLNKASSSNNAQQIADFLSGNFGNAYSARASLLHAVWVRPHWGIALLPVELNLDMSIHQTGGAAVDLIAHQDTTLAYGRGWDVWWFGKDQRMSLGVVGKAIYRGYFNKALLASDLALDSNILSGKDANEGFTADADFGLLWTPTITKSSWWRFAKPSVGIVLRNIADYGFKTNFHLIDKNSGEADKLGRRLDIGTKVDLPDWWIWRTRLAADMKDIGHENFTFKKGSHIGAEFLWKVKSWWQGGWRVGLNQGYFTAGLTATLGVFTLDLVTYGDELGPSDAPKSIRNYGLKASLDF